MTMLTNRELIEMLQAQDPDQEVKVRGIYDAFGYELDQFSVNVEQEPSMGGIIETTVISD